MMAVPCGPRLGSASNDGTDPGRTEGAVVEISTAAPSLESSATDQVSQHPEII
jgi:hypothetical protein